MERSRSVISIVVGLAAILIVWRVGFYPPVPEKAPKPVAGPAAVEPNKPSRTERPGRTREPMVSFDVNEPGKPSDGNEPKQVAAAGASAKPGDSNEPMESLNLKSVEMKSIVQKLAEWTGKAIIPTDESMKQKVTIYAPDKLPRSEALSMIYAALRMRGFTPEFDGNVIFLKPIAEAKLGEVPTIAADFPLAMVENKDAIVQKFFRLKNYGASQMAQIIQPLIGEYGYVGADETTSSLLVIDTVKNLMRMELIIQQYDIVEAEEIETAWFEIKNGNPEEIVALLERLLSSGAGGSSRSSRGSFGSRPPDRGGSSSRGGSRGSGGTVTTVTVGTSRTPASLVAEPKYNWIIVRATAEDIKLIGEWIEKLDRSVPTIMVDYPLSRIENKNQVVQKVFRLENYDAAQMAEIVGPLVSDSGNIVADQSTRTIMLTDTVQNLIKIEGVIEQFDVPEAEQTVNATFEIYNGDPAEIVQVLRTLLSFDGSGGSSRSSYDRNRYGSSSYGRSSSYGSYNRGSSYRSSSSRSSSSPIIGTSQVPIVLIPEPTRKWIIARASAEDMKKISEWIEKLDKKEAVGKEYETITLGYADPSEVAQRLNEAIQQMPGSELQASVLVQPLAQARQIVVFGRQDIRDMVKKLVSEIDIPSGMFETRVFQLKHADPDQVKENLDGLYETQAGTSTSMSYSFNRYSARSRNVDTKDTIKTIAFPTMKQVTVIASAENMLKIAEQIDKWDIPLDVEQVKPRIITLRNSDPVQMADLLTTLFSEQSSGGASFWDRYYGTQDDKQKIVGPLYGQLTFEDVPGTKKIIVISNIAAAYDVVESLVQDLDSQEMAEIPEVIELMYADPEDLSERLNALFVDAGQQAPIRLTAQGLSASSEMGDTSTSGNTNSSSSNNSSSTQQSTYTPPWSGAGARSNINNEMPISNVIGKVRFVPEPHRKAVMVLAPREFLENIQTLISQLDVPGKQVIIEAIIVEIEHTKVTSLGVELATNPASFGTLSENSIEALGNLTHLGTYGSLSGRISPTSTQPFNTTGTSGTVLGVGTDIYGLIDFLIRKTNARILNQQTVWTKDNEEANFFKGSEVAFLTSESITNQTATQGINFEKVGMELRARPSITPEAKVDMIVNVQISSLTSELVNSQPVRNKMNTTTNMILKDGQTLLLGGILFQKDSTVEHKLPLLGDLPLIGGLFRHNNIIKSNSEMLVFMTPHVVDDPTEEIPESSSKQEKLEKVREQLDATLQNIDD